MAKQILNLSPFVQFQNGTVLEGSLAPGSTTLFTSEAKGLRSAQLPSEIDTSPQFERAMQELGIYEQETIHVDQFLPADLRAGGPEQEPLVLRPTVATGDANPRVVLYQDESGGLSWHFAEGTLLTKEQQARAAKRGLRVVSDGSPRFVIPTRTAAARRSLQSGPSRGSLRGPITKIGRKILKVLVIPMVSTLLENPLQKIVGAIENKYRENLIWQVTPENFNRPPVAPFSGWADLRDKRSLLLVHGIFSSVEGMISVLPRMAMEKWYQVYEGRVIAFNHLSATLSPEDNARFFLERARAALPDGKMQFDVVCHSRGGVVSRALAEQGHKLVPLSNCEFKSIFFVASPNQGSVLGNPDHMLDMLDVFTNMLTQFPDGPVLYSIEVLLAIVKLLAYAAGEGLPGVEAMGTESYIKKTLNAGREPSPARYGAAASDYEPVPGLNNGFLLGRFADAVMDRIFRQGDQPIANDLVVPRDGVYAANGHPSFPILGPLLFRPSDHIWHTAFFSRSETIDRIDQHLQISEGTRLAKEDGSVASSPSPRGTLRGGPQARDQKDGGASEPALSLPATTVERQPNIEFHELMVEGETSDLVVRLDEIERAYEVDNVILLALAAGQAEVTFTVELSAPGFDITGSRHASITVKRNRDPQTEKAVFRLTAKSPGPKPLSRQIIATFWQANNCLGAVSHFTKVVPKDYGGLADPDGSSVSDRIRVSAKLREFPDLVVYVRRVRTEPESYELSLRCQLPENEYDLTPMGEFDLGGADLAKFFSEAIDPEFRSFPDATLPDAEFDEALQDWNHKFINRLHDFGKSLWLQLPKDFREEYVRLMSLDYPARSISVHSDEMIFPWEIVIPTGTVNRKYAELPPLGVSHILGRWKPGLGARPQPQAVPVRSMAILNPRYTSDPLAWSTQETGDLVKLIGEVEVLSPVNRAAVDKILGRMDLKIVHFSGHGDWDNTTNADLSALRLENNESIPAMSFAANRLGQEAQPILYLNACTIGRVARVMGRPGGFAANCIASGWSGVIAPYWPVYDPKAYEFTLQLYRKLKLGRSVGEGLQEIRAENPDDPTSQSYSYFGDPWARVLFA